MTWPVTASITMHDVTVGVESSLPLQCDDVIQESETLGNQVTPTYCAHCTESCRSATSRLRQDWFFNRGKRAVLTLLNLHYISTKENNIYPRWQSHRSFKSWKKKKKIITIPTIKILASFFFLSNSSSHCLFHLIVNCSKNYFSL